ncbi:MAG: recombinase family protein [Megasphaera sp.]|jgi:DNA invertase Pin-like site-specific DNA recombinase|nr:recombinase family protein [Megasphaera sp.]MCH4217127.1 recombinase family protein [Megasphaera sp.]
MKSFLYGYIRVSSKDQNTERQWDALLKFGIEEKHIYSDKQSGKDFDRPHYKRLLRKIRKGDCIVITSLDRLGRNYTEIQDQWRHITKFQQVDIVVLDMPLLDTRKSRENLMGIFLADIVLQILSYVAETERNSIRQRQSEGIAAAKSRGVHFGRVHKPLPGNFNLVMQQWQQGELTAKEAANMMNVSCSWLYRKLDLFQNINNCK